jgi:NAD(P)-dependent dehydrogenase (short-subunit alcohol dehydrogenase family)
MDYQIKGKLAFVTAGAHGIGEAIANVLAQEGANVLVADIDETALREKAHCWKGTVPADLATAQGVDAAVAYVLDTFGRAPHILVNNLGLADPAPFTDLSDARWGRSFDINLMGCVRTCRTLLPLMADGGEGAAVVNIASDLAKQPEPVPMDYGACKSGLLYVTKALAKEYAPRVRVNAVSPGPVWTRLWSRPGGIADQLAQHYGLDRDAATERFLQDRYMPLGIGQPEDVAHAVAFLASPLARFITGANLDIGGTLRGLI